jgi:hypothetical protein
MDKLSKFYDLKSELESSISEFIQITDEIGKDYKDELNDILTDAQRATGVPQYFLS